MGREEILRRIRAGLGAHPPSEAEQLEREQRLQTPPVGPRVPFTGDLVTRFLAKATANLFTFERLQSLQMLVPAVRELLSNVEGDPDISVAPALAHLGWPAEWKINSGIGRPVEPMSVTLALAGIAETGSVVMRSSPDMPTSLNFLPDTHVIVLRAADIVGYAEDVWRRIHADGTAWPRTVNVISGPSRTADVGGILVRPAHGPKRVHLMIVDG